MTRKTVVQCASLAFVSAVTASFGMTSFVTADTISHTGAHSPQEHKIKPIIKNKCEIDTENQLDIENENKQKAESGDVTVKGEEHKKDEHNKWGSETPKDEVQPSSAESTDQATEQPMVADQAAATLAEADQQTASKPESDENWKSDHEDHDQSKVGNVTTGDAINSNESKFEVNIETDNECPIIKKAPKAHKPEHKVQPSMKPKVTPSKAAAPQVSAGAGQGVGGQGGGFGAGAAPRAQVQQPVAQPSKPVQPPAPKPVAPRPPEHVSNNVNITTNNSVSISNTNYQHAESGSATVNGNTHVGNVSTGDAVNHNSTRASVNIDTSNTVN